MRSLTIDREKTFFLPTGDIKQLSEDVCYDYVEQMVSLPFEEFDELMAEMSKLRLVKLDKNNWKLSSCTCKWYLKHYMCKHIIVVAVRKNLYTLDPRAEQIPVGQNRKRGRPKNTTPPYSYNLMSLLH